MVSLYEAQLSESKVDSDRLDRDSDLSVALNSSNLVAEPIKSYKLALSSSSTKWVEVLIDFPGVQGLYTYSLPHDLLTQPGDIVSVPFGMQKTGGIVIQLLDTPPVNLEVERIRPIEDIVSSGFFPERYWELLQRVAEYYLTDLMSAIRVALPPGLLGRTQRRIRLVPDNIPQGAETFCSSTARQILQLLQRQKDGNYSVKYLRNQEKGADRGIRELTKRGWVESYLEPPKRIQAKLQTAVTLVTETFLDDLTSRQKEVLQVLRQNGGEMWQQELINLSRTSTATLKKIAERGYITFSEKEILRKEQGIAQTRDIPKELSPAQAEALKVINNQTGYAQILLHGVTGSGKTEVYLQAIASILAQGKSALVLVPEIGLTPQLTDRFRARFADQVCVYHSKLSDGERYDTWRQTIQGEPQVIIGTRSAIFAPLPNLGLIVLDEEHDSSFKQDRPIPTYHARTVANWRGELANCPLVLGSATPSLESLVETREQGSRGDQKLSQYYLSLPERIASRPLPPVEIVDMREELNRGNRSIFSSSLQNALADIQERQQQAILFIPRRGHSTFVSCRSCGFVMECPNCDVSLSYHYTHEGAAKLLRCHYCNYTSIQPNSCPECCSPYLKFFGSGTQKVTQEISKLFPDLRWIRFDSDTTRNKNAHRDLIARFTSKQADILVGTQMLTKGLDIAGVTLVGVVSADGLLHRSDYRAAERAFQTLTQVAGRAGRGDEQGRVIIQTYSPEHPVIRAVKNHDYASFSSAELEQREALNYPPHGKLILIKLSSVNETEVRETAEALADACLNLLADEWELLGPAPASVMRVARRYRWQILLKYPGTDKCNLPDFNSLRKICPKSVSMIIDVDPINMD
ncbi:MAG: primosomal protein N' [Xenococcaceae cyanobacterium MO_234.B1]|nr:primosomal protein N' [Xenococcaceae cyanobacterium MO_234.B1]